MSRENRYAESILKLLSIKKQFYANALNMITERLPTIEKMLQDTTSRPVFGEDIIDHLRTTGRKIAFPIGISTSFLRKSGLTDEGLFRLSTQQVKLDKLKAHLDANLPFDHLLEVRITK